MVLAHKLSLFNVLGVLLQHYGTREDVTARISNVNDMLREKPSVGLTHDAMTWIRKFPIERLEKGRLRELENLIKFDAFDDVHKLPFGHKAYDMIWVYEWRGEKVRSRLCVQQFKAEQPWDDIPAGTLEIFSMRYLINRAVNDKSWGILILDVSVAIMHARADEAIYVRKKGTSGRVDLGG